jgi:hypothetical protein
MPVTPLLKGLGGLLGEIPLESIQSKPDTATTPEDLTTLTSYNLLPKQKRTIIVPGEYVQLIELSDPLTHNKILGSPPVWAPATGSKKLKPDAGKYIMDPSRHVFPKCPLEPLLRALVTTQPDFNMKDIDLVTDRRNLRLLLAFVSGQKSAFRIDVEVVRCTVLFSCWTPNSTRFVMGFEGYGHEFEKASTRQPSGLGESMTHNRVICYVLGGVKIMVRFEVDACIGSKRDTSRTMSVSNKDQTPTGYTVLTRGHIVEPSRIVEIKTGPAGKNLAISKNIAQLWFSQTPILCTGQYSSSGVFSEVTQKDLMREGKLAKWEEDNREKLGKLVRVIEMIVEVVRTVPRGKCALILPAGDNVLKIYDVTNQGDKGIPKDLLAMWKV